MICAISGEAPEDPMISKKSWLLFERKKPSPPPRQTPLQPPWQLPPPPQQLPQQSARDAFVEAAAVRFLCHEQYLEELMRCDICVNIVLPVGTELAEPSQEGSIWSQERGSVVEFLGRVWLHHQRSAI
ncbi:hypothetical protein AAC387_Pa01g4002 [Persea americana]